MLIPLKIENTVHHVLQDLWPCDGSFLIDMADHKHCNILAFGQLHQGHSAALYLGHAAGRTIQLRVIKSLDGVNNQNIRPLLLHGIQYVREAGFRQHHQFLAEC